MVLIFSQINPDLFALMSDANAVKDILSCAAK
jgi:hypothetical protein